jgi:hypothetical protein
MGILSSFRTQKPKKLKPRTQAIDPKLPRGKVGKGPLEPRDSTTRVFMDPMKRIKSNMAERPKRDNPAYSGNAIMALNKGPGMKKGGVLKKAMGGMLGPHPQQGRPMNIAAPQGPSVQQPLRNMTIPYGKIANKGPGLKKGGSVKKMKDGGGVCAGASNNRRSRQGAEIVK